MLQQMSYSQIVLLLVSLIKQGKIAIYLCDININVAIKLKMDYKYTSLFVN